MGGRGLGACSAAGEGSRRSTRVVIAARFCRDRGVTDAKHRILVVDDDEDIRTTLAEVLELEGFATQTAENGQVALTRLQHEAEAPCLILLDLMMPVMNGLQFLDACRGDAKLSGIPVAIVTANGALGGEEKDRIRAPILPKPIAIDQLLALVHRLC